ncbi:MAG: phosphate/phosphite/phosphonate ABC transporter substrate-binding protein [Pseudomonadota bacterium]
MKKIQPIIFCFLMLLAITAMAQEYTIGILVKHNATDFYERWLMHAAYLEKSIGESFVIKPLKVSEVDKAISSGNIDFLLTSPTVYVEMKEKYKISAIVTMIKHTKYGAKLSQFGGVIFTSASSDINTLEDIKGKTFIAVNKTSLSGYQMALKEFKDNDIVLENVTADITFVGTQRKVAEMVLNRPGTIGTVRTNVLENMALTGAISLKNIKIINQKKESSFPYLLSTTLYPQWAMAMLPKTDKIVAQKVSNALKKMKSNQLAIEMAGIAGWKMALDYSKLEIMLRSIGTLKHEDTIKPES